MKPPPFEYSKPASLDDAVKQLGESPDDTKLLAGGQSLIPLLNFRLAYPRRLIDLNGLTSLAYIREADGWLRIGAMTRAREVEQSALVRRRIPILSQAIHWVGHIQIRNRGTIGGSIAHADPSAEVPALCVLLDAEFQVAGSKGSRIANAAGFFHGFLSTELGADEVLEEVRLPIPAPESRFGFREFAHRRGDFALAGAACVIQKSQDGAISEARIAIFGATDAPTRSEAAEHFLMGKRVSPEIILEAARAAKAAIGVENDEDGERAYRRDLTGVMLRRALDDATSERVDHGHE